MATSMQARYAENTLVQEAGIPILGAQWAAFAGVTGMLCIFPLDLPGTLSAAAAFGAVGLASCSIAAANALAVQLGNKIKVDNRSIVSFAAVACIAAAIPLGILSAFVDDPFSSPAGFAPAIIWAALVDLPALFLFFWLVSRMSAVRMTSRYLLAPLFTTLASLPVVQPTLSARSILGLLLVAAGAFWLIFAPEVLNVEESTPLHLDGK